MPDWIDDELERIADARNPNPPSDEQIGAAVQRWWKQLADDINGALVRMRGQGFGGEMTTPQENRYEVRNPLDRLTLRIVLDREARTVSFEYHSEAPRVAEPLGGFLSLRPRGQSRVVAFYSDQELSQDQVLRTLLKPVLFPAMPSDEAA